MKPTKIEIERRRDGWYVIYHYIAGGILNGLPMTMSQGPFLTRRGARNTGIREAKLADRDPERETIWGRP